MSKSENEKIKRAQRTREFLAQLAERYPRCFTRDPQAVRPLAIGIQQHLREEVGREEALKDTPNWLIRQALALYTRSGAYLNAIVEKRPRINLDGSDAGEVTDEAQAHAQEQIEQLKKRRAERRPQPPEQQPRKPRPHRPRAPATPKEPSMNKLEALARKFAKE
jgi:ProP effector